LAAICIAVWAASASDRPRVWNANLADWDAVLLRTEEPFYVSGFQPVLGLATARLAVSGSLEPTYDREGAHAGLVRSQGGSVATWFAPNPAWAVGLGGSQAGWLETHANGAEWSLRAAADRKTLPLSIYYHGDPGPGRPRFSALARLLDGERGTWLAVLSAVSSVSAVPAVREEKATAAKEGGGALPRWKTELRLWRDKNQENWSIQAREGADSLPRMWKAGYRDAVWGTGIYARGESGFGSFAGKGEYSMSRPDFIREAYQIGDSSRTLRAGLELRPRPAFAGGNWNLRSDYSESQVFTEGLRLPPDAAEFKRFHHALGQALSLYSGAEWETPGRNGATGPTGRKGTIGDFRFRAGAFHRYYRYRTSPHPDAYYERKETLSYNRLESSLLASLYGGFQQSAELITAYFRLQSLEFRPALSADFGRFGADISAPMAYARLDARVAGETVSRKLLAVDIERRYGWDLRGTLATAAPGIALRYRQGPAQVTARACHALVLWNGLRSGGGGAGAATGGGDAYPWEGNAALLEASATLDF
jgi:hypothetical protein